MDLISEIENAWGWVGIKPVSIFSENDFGNLIIMDLNGLYWRLSPEDIYCEIIAKNMIELNTLLKNEEFLIDWNMKALVDQARDKFGILEKGRKYSLVIPSVLGGAYDISNIKPVPLVELIRFSGDLGEQISDLPDGQQIELKIVD